MKTVKTLTNDQESKATLSFLDRKFKITERGSSIGAELRGGLVTFFAMAYILVLNPIILAIPAEAVGISPSAIAAGTALVAGIMTILMGVVANFPLAMAAGMGLNAMVAFTLCLGLGLSFQEAMGLIFWEGVLITILVLTGFRNAVFKAIPTQLKIAISVGIGMFIAFIGLVNAGIVRPAAGTPVELGIHGSLDGWPALIFVIGLVVTIVLYVRKVRGAILIGIFSSTIVAVIVQYFVHLPNKSEAVPTGWGLTIPAFEHGIVAIPDFSTLGQISFFGAFHKLGFLAVLLLIFSLMLADFFDTMGTMVAIGAEADLLDEDGNPEHSRAILLVDSLSAVVGGLGGVSSNTAYVESSAGVGEGARTGLSSVFTGILFLLATFLAPIVEIVPSEAASTALVFVGFLMMMQVSEINWKDPEIAIPAFLTIGFMPFSYSITVGIGMGIVSFFVIKLGKGKLKEIHPLMWIVSILFILYFVLGPVQRALGA
ncbi:NCS2 family permease [Boudabousia marimammalium]|uniref:Permease n=1 Tax=Boudabousia marimammalium TaxID=156892 RepID=A0A1Q5PMA2_9ACTO|nr:NCS2 family permease [Boudabousia marimammalium]OKL48674.1 permease [Boudabousia marimammalium]